MTKRTASAVAEKIKTTAKSIQDKILKKQKPTMSTPVRSLGNVKYKADGGHFEILGKNKVRTLTVSTVKTFAQTLKMMSLSKELIDTSDMATKRASSGPTAGCAAATTVA